MAESTLRPAVAADTVSFGRRVAPLAFALLCLSWGSTWLLSKNALAYTPPLMFVGLRAFAGGLVLWFACGCKGAPQARAVWPGAVLMTAVNFGLISWGLLHVQSGLAATVNLATIPLAVALCSGRPGVRQWLGIALGAIGLALTAGSASQAWGGMTSLGVLAIVAGSSCYGIGTVMVKSAGDAGNPIRLACWQSLTGGALLLLGSSVSEPWTGAVWRAIVTPAHLLDFALIVLLSTVIGLSIYLSLLRFWAASTVATYAYVCPIVAIAVGWFAGGEHLAPRQLFACVLLIGAAIVTCGSQSATRKP